MNGRTYQMGISPSPSPSLTQTAKVVDLIESHGMEEGNPVTSPYHYGLVIDHILDDNIPVERKRWF
jgi:hypothetical protein